MVIIVNADDFGMSTSVNDAITECFHEKMIHRTTVMTNMPAFEDAVRKSEVNGFKKRVGLHLVLDEGIPLTDIMKYNPHFCREDKFIKGCLSKIVRRMYLSSFDMKCLKMEIEAQMQAYCNAGFSLMHLDSHHLVHTSSPIIINIVKDSALKYGFKSMRNVALYPHDGLVQRIVKKYVMHVIISNFETTENFASYNQYPLGLDDIEYMSHPDIIDGKVVDFLNRRTGDFRAFSR